MAEKKTAEVRPGQIRLSINLAEDAAAALRDYCEAHTCTITEGVRRAIAILKFIDDERASSNKIYVVDEGVDTKGRRDVVSMRELVFLD